MKTKHDRNEKMVRASMPRLPRLIAIVAFAMIVTLGSGIVQAQGSQEAESKDWCGTYRLFAEKYPDKLLARDGDCGIFGDCDIAANRDAMIPDGSTPWQTFRLKFHVFREDDGTNAACTQAQVDDNVATLNAVYAAFNIQFTYTTEFNDDSEYRSMSEAEKAAMKTAYADDPANQCNVYVTTVESGFSWGTFPWDAAALGATGGIVMNRSHFGLGDDILAHEMGHIFGLLHTQRGVSESPDAFPDCDWGCYEHAGSNSDITGDYCSDTPPTPTNNSCTDPAGVDPCTGDTPWAPTWMENYMGYGGPGCWDAFSPQQMGRMHCWMDAVLMPWVDPDAAPPNEPPVAQCADVTVSADGDCEAMADINDGSFDPEGSDITLEQTPPGPYPLGTTVVTLTVTDPEGLTDECDAVVTVIDDTPPVAQCPADITAPSDPDECSAVVSFAVSATDNCSGVTVAATPPSGSTFELGVTEVTVVATDAAGITDVCYFNVTVSDAELPIAICPDPITAPNDPDECSAVVTFAISATDNCPGVTVAATPPSGSTFELGVTDVTVVATDASGNTGSCRFEVTVIDTQNPVVSCPEDLDILFISPSQAVIEFEATATDNCDEFPAIVCTPGSGSVFPIGENTVTCIATDEAGNADTCSFTFVLVYLDIKPLSCPNPLNVKPYREETKEIGNMAAGDTDGQADPFIDVRKPMAVIPVAILSSDEFDVHEIVPDQVEFNGVRPLKWAWEDVTTPADNDDYCGCTTADADGLMDLTLKFNTEEVVASLGAVLNGDVIQLLITGVLTDGTPFYGGDCVIIRGPKSLADTDGAEAPSEEPVSSGNFPNPFNPATEIRFTLPTSAAVTLDIYNALGQRVATLVNATLDAGEHKVPWDGTGFSSGVYFYRLKADDFTQTRKMVLMK